jgi:hypothetical protein
MVCAASTLTAVPAMLRVLIVALLAAVLSGCQLRIGVDVAVERRGSGVLAVTVGADQELLARAEAAGADPLGMLAERGRSLAREGWQVTEERRDDLGRTVRLTAEFAGPEEYEALTTDLAEALAAPEIRMLEPFTLELTDDRIVLRGGAGLQPTGVAVDPGVAPEHVLRLLDAEDALVYDVRVRLPGEVLEHNATRRQEDVLVWDVPPGQRVDVLAVGTRPPPLVPVLAVGLLAGASAGLAVVLLRRRRLGRRAPDRTAV